VLLQHLRGYFAVGWGQRNCRARSGEAPALNRPQRGRIWPKRNAHKNVLPIQEIRIGRLEQPEGELKSSLRELFGEQDFILFHHFFLNLEFMRDQLLAWAKEAK
jgi:hypothetical protein